MKVKTGGFSIEGGGAGLVWEGKDGVTYNFKNFSRFSGLFRLQIRQEFSLERELMLAMLESGGWGNISFWPKFPNRDKIGCGRNEILCVWHDFYHISSRIGPSWVPPLCTLCNLTQVKNFERFTGLFRIHKKTA